MALMDKWQQTVEKLTRPVLQLDKQTHDDGEYAKAFLKCLTNLEQDLYGVCEPQKVALHTLATACEFYDADWCGIMDVDMKLGIWMPFWWYNRTTGGMTKTLLDDTGVVGIYPRWVEALENNSMIIVDDVEELKESRLEEYEVYSKMNTKSLMAVPYRKREQGFLLLRNPQRYANHPELLRVMSYVLVTEIIEQKLLDKMRMTVSQVSIESSKDVVINLFGGFEIYTSKGKLTETEFKSPLCCKVLLLLMNRHRSLTSQRACRESVAG